MRSSWRSDVPLYLSGISKHLSSTFLLYNVHAGAVEAVLAGDGLPEGGTDLVTLHCCQSHALLPSSFGCSHTHWPVWRWTYTHASLAVCFCCFFIVDTQTRGTRAGQGLFLCVYTYNLTHGGGVDGSGGVFRCRGGLSVIERLVGVGCGVGVVERGPVLRCAAGSLAMF